MCSPPVGKEVMVTLRGRNLAVETDTWAFQWSRSVIYSSEWPYAKPDFKLCRAEAKEPTSPSLPATTRVAGFTEHADFLWANKWPPQSSGRQANTDTWRKTTHWCTEQQLLPRSRLAPLRAWCDVRVWECTDNFLWTFATWPSLHPPLQRLQYWTIALRNVCKCQWECQIWHYTNWECQKNKFSKGTLCHPEGDKLFALN